MLAIAFNELSIFIKLRNTNGTLNKQGFQLGNDIEPFHVRTYVYMS